MHLCKAERAAMALYAGRVRRGIAMVALMIALPLIATSRPAWSEDPSASPHYQLRKASRDGSGKVYMGREISHVMGHRGANWLERTQRVQEERTDLLLGALSLKPDDTVVDLGAGTGYFSFPMAEQVPQGTVLAVDIQPEMLAIIEQRIVDQSAANVEPVLAGECDPNLAGREVNVVLLVDAYHEFSCPREVMQAVVASLAPDGRVILVEYRGEDPSIGIKPLHTMSVAQVTTEMAAVGLELQANSAVLPKQHLLTFRRAATR